MNTKEILEEDDKSDDNFSFCEECGELISNKRTICRSCMESYD